MPEAAPDADLRDLRTVLADNARLMPAFVADWRGVTDPAGQPMPISALPEVDYPTIQVQTFYPGASPEVMTSAVTAPLERQLGQTQRLAVQHLGLLGIDLVKGERRELEAQSIQRVPDRRSSGQGAILKAENAVATLRIDVLHHAAQLRETCQPEIGRAHV